MFSHSLHTVRTWNRLWRGRYANTFSINSFGSIVHMGGGASLPHCREELVCMVLWRLFPFSPSSTETAAAPNMSLPHSIPPSSTSTSMLDWRSISASPIICRFLSGSSIAWSRKCWSCRNPKHQARSFPKLLWSFSPNSFSAKLLPKTLKSFQALQKTMSNLSKTIGFFSLMNSKLVSTFLHNSSSQKKLSWNQTFNQFLTCSSSSFSRHLQLFPSSSKILSIDELQFLLLPCSSGTKTSLSNSSKSNNNRFFKASPKSIKSELTKNLLKTKKISQNFGLLKVKKSISSYYYSSSSSSSSSSTLQQFPILSIPQLPRLPQNFFAFPPSHSLLWPSSFEIRAPTWWEKWKRLCCNRMRKHKNKNKKKTPEQKSLSNNNRRKLQNRQETDDNPFTPMHVSTETKSQKPRRRLSHSCKLQTSSVSMAFFSQQQHLPLPLSLSLSNTLSLIALSRNTFSFFEFSNTSKQKRVQEDKQKLWPKKFAKN